MSVAELPRVRGRLTPDAPLAPLVWFKAGGAAEWLFEPADAEDLAAFLGELDPAVPVLGLGLGSNLIVRDGGVPGVVVRLGKAFAKVERADATTLRCGGGASGILVSSTARDAGIGGLEFLRSIPGTVGGFVRMNGGAYSREVRDILVECEVVLRSGQQKTLALAELGYTYRHSELPDGSIVVGATFRGHTAEPAVIQAEMDRIAAEREASQPLRSRTGGSTFKNPPGTKAWREIDAAGCRGLTIGDAQVSEKHCNFLLNLGKASAAEIEALGEEVRRRVRAHSGVELEMGNSTGGRGQVTKRLSDYEQRIMDFVESAGCFITAVFDPEGDQPDFAYSTGFPASLAQNDVLISGLGMESMKVLTNDMHGLCREGFVLQDFARTDQLFSGFDCVVREVAEDNLVAEYWNSAIWYQERYRKQEFQGGYQLVWPDKEGRFPWEAGITETFADVQLRLWERGSVH